jgi:spermidine synthase
VRNATLAEVDEAVVALDKENRDQWNQKEEELERRFTRPEHTQG